VGKTQSASGGIIGYRVSTKIHHLARQRFQQTVFVNLSSILVNLNQHYFILIGHNGMGITDYDTTKIFQGNQQHFYYSKMKKVCNVS
jgi:hypothetical protein